MKPKRVLPKGMIAAINRLANEELRTSIPQRAKALRIEYVKRLLAGELIDLLQDEICDRTASAIVQNTIKR